MPAFALNFLPPVLRMFHWYHLSSPNGDRQIVKSLLLTECDKRRVNKSGTVHTPFVLRQKPQGLATRRPAYFKILVLEGKLAMRCQHCSYPIFSYTRCCPSCSQAVESNNEAKYADAPQTRIGFSLVHLRRIFASFAISLTSLIVSNHQQ